MIQLTKLDEPTILLENKETWTSELLELIKRDEPIPENLQRKYNHIEIKDTLRDETSGKCMYCESPVSHITYEHIEHIKPKARNKYPELTFEWNNLGLSCPICNMNKGEDYDGELPFINPYIENPSNFLSAYGPFIYQNAGNKKGELSIKTIELNRPGLIERRKERIDSIRNLADRYVQETNPGLKAILLKEIEIEIGNDKPYSMCANSVYNGLLNG